MKFPCFAMRYLTYRGFGYKKEKINIDSAEE